MGIKKELAGMDKGFIQETEYPGEFIDKLDWDPADAIATPSTALSPFSSNYYMPVGDEPTFGENLKEGLGSIWDTVKKMYDPSNPYYQYTPANPKISQYLPHNMLLNWLTGDKELSEEEREQIKDMKMENTSTNIYNDEGEQIFYPRPIDYRSKEEYEEAVRDYDARKTRNKRVRQASPSIGPDGAPVDIGPDGNPIPQGPPEATQSQIYEQKREDYENSEKRAVLDKKLERLRRKAEEMYYKARAFEFQDRI